MNDDDTDTDANDGWAMNDSSNFDGMRAAEDREAAAPAQPPEPAAPAPAAPQYSAGDYQVALGQLDTELNNLAGRYESGELEFRQYRQEERRLEDVRAQLGSGYHAAATAEQQESERWNSDLNKFFSTDEGKPFAPGTGLNAALSETVGAHLRAGKPANLATLKSAAREAREQLRAAVGLGGSRRTAAVSTRDRYEDDGADDAGWAASTWR